MRRFRTKKGAWIVAHALIAAATLNIPTSMIPTSMAGTTSVELLEGNFRVGLSAHAGVLAYANDPSMMPMMQMQAGWVFSNQLQAMFNMPALQIFNEDGSIGNIVQVALTIGDDRFNFSDFLGGGLTQEVPNFDLPVGVVASVQTSGGASASAGADDADRLILDFLNGGLVPNDSTLFKIKVGSDSNFPLFMPSFDEVFFDANGRLAFDGGMFDPATDDNSTVIVTYEDPNTGERRAADPVPLLDFAVSPPTGTAIHPMPVIDPHFVSGRLNPIPEPSSLAAAMVGIAILWAPRRRRK